MYHLQKIPNFDLSRACKCAGTCLTCRQKSAIAGMVGTDYPTIGHYQMQAPSPESRIGELQTKAHLSPGEKIELEMLLKKKWG
jgi:hypothetical protein